MAVAEIRGSTQIIANTVTSGQVDSSIIVAGGGNAFTADQSMGSHKLTNVTDPVGAQDAATKNYVDSVSQGLDVKASVRVATTANITLSAPQTIDGIAVVAGDRVLVKAQTAGQDNGIYVVAAGAWSRAADANASAEVTSGMYCYVEEGTAGGTNGYLLTTVNPITLGTTVLVFTQFSGAGQITAGNGLTKTGNTLDVGAGTGLTVAADSIGISAGGVGATQIASAALGNGLQGGGGTTLSIKLNGATLAVGASGLNIAAAGVTATEIAAAALLSTGGLQGGAGTALSIKLDGTSLSTSASGIKVNPAKWITRETPTGLVNGANTTYTLANTPIAGSESVYLNGILQEQGAGTDYTIAAATITYLAAPATGDKIRVNYMIA